MGVIEELEIALAPVLLCGGRRLFENLREGVPQFHPQLAFAARLVELAKPHRHVAATNDRAPASLDDGDHLVMEAAWKIKTSPGRPA